MNILAIESASESCSVALHFEGETVQRNRLGARAHAELILPWVEELLQQADTRLQALDALAFSRGPGSFTSLRIGIGIAQGLAWGAGIPVIPVSSLQCAAQVAAAQGVQQALVAMDARMGEVFCGSFRLDENGLMQATGAEAVLAPEQVVARASAGWVGVGSGFARYPVLQACADQLDAVYDEIWPQASAMIALALHQLETQPALPAEQAQPVYLRDQVAHKPGTAKK